MRTPVRVQTNRNPLSLACGFPGTGFASSTGLARRQRSGTFLHVLESLTGCARKQVFGKRKSPIFAPLKNTRSR